MKINKLQNILLLFFLSFLILNSCSDDSDFGGKDNFITSFQLEKDGIVFNSAISATGEILVNIPENFSLEGAKATFVVSEHAQISPDPESITNWDETQSFIVKSYNGSEKTYTYSVKYGSISHNGDIVLLTEADMEAFAKMKLSEINGSLTIGATSGEDSIQSLALLSSLRSIKFDLVINSTYAGKTLEGFGNLEEVGSLKITQSQTLENISLPKLKKAVTGLMIDQLSALKEVSLPELVSVERSLSISKNDLLESIDLPKLEIVIEDFTISGGWNANVLSRINVASLKSVGGNMIISDWKKLEELSLPKLERVSLLHLLSLEQIGKVEIPSLVSIASECRIVYNQRLKDIDLSSLENIGGKFNIENLAITSVDGLKSLKTVGGELFISNLSKLKNTKGLSSLERIGGRLYLSSMPDLEDNLDGLASINYVAGEILISGVPFKKFSGFNLKEVNSIGIYADGLSSIEEIDFSKLTVTKKITLQNILTSFILKGPSVFEGELRIDGNTPKQIDGFNEVGSLYCYITDATFKERTLHISKVKGDATLSIYNFDKFSMPNLVGIEGKLSLSVLSDDLILDLPKLKTIGSMDMGSPKIGKLSLPILETIEGDCKIVTANYSGILNEIDLPRLTRINGTLDLSGYSSYYSNNTLTNLNGMSSLTSLQGLVIEYNELLVDFSGLRKALSSLTLETWKVANNGYNPTFEEAKAGKLVRP